MTLTYYGITVIRMTDEYYITKVTSKFQTTIPKAFREELGIRQGDAVRFSMEGGKLVVEKSELAMDDHYYQHLNNLLGQEWNSAADDQLFADL